MRFAFFLPATTFRPPIPAISNPPAHLNGFSRFFRVSTEQRESTPYIRAIHLFQPAQ